MVFNLIRFLLATAILKRNLKLMHVKKLFIGGLIALLVSFSPLSNATLLKFEFAGSGETYDDQWQPTNHYAVSLEFLLDTDGLPDNTSSGGDILGYFDFSSPISNVSLNIDNGIYNVEYSQQSMNAYAYGIAVNDGMTFWENYFYFGFGDKRFGINYWNHGALIYEDEFILSDYYIDMTGFNAPFNFLMSDEERILGVFSDVTISAVPEPSILALLSLGLVILGCNRRKTT